MRIVTLATGCVETTANKDRRYEESSVTAIVLWRPLTIMSRSNTAERDPLLLASSAGNSGNDVVSSSKQRRCAWLGFALILVCLCIQMVLQQYPRWFVDYQHSFQVLFPYGRFLQLASFFLPIHMLFAPIALFGGMIQVTSGLARWSFHRITGKFVAVANILALLPAYPLAIACQDNKGWYECLNLIILATYTMTCLVVALRAILPHDNNNNKNVQRHQEFMLRNVTGWFVFVAYRWVVYPTHGNYFLAGCAMMATFASVEIVLCLLRKEPWWQRELSR
mmetsp:Transcript_13222/g.24812  ORF Transcript_13222/g.24812 Transcript_13222/m.24812 type:complete len:279 (+) Transcript_13222:293-1129(+)